MHLGLVACSGAGALEQPTTVAATQSRLVKPGMARIRPTWTSTVCSAMNNRSPNHADYGDFVAVLRHAPPWALWTAMTSRTVHWRKGNSSLTLRRGPHLGRGQAPPSSTTP